MNQKKKMMMMMMMIEEEKKKKKKRKKEEEEGAVVNDRFYDTRVLLCLCVKKEGGQFEVEDEDEV